MNTTLKCLSVALALAIATPAAAADLGGSLKDDGYTSYRIDWTGLYFGANLGGAWANGSASYAIDGIRIFSGSTDDSGVIGGAQIGYNWQTGNLVFGLEADIAAQDLSKSAQRSLGGARGTLSQESKWVGTVRPKLGFVASQNLSFTSLAALPSAKLKEAMRR